MRRYAISFLLLVLAGCKAFNAPDVPATLHAENTAYIAEATILADTYQTEQAAIQATAQIAGTTIAQANSINRQLVATARAVIPPTAARQVGSGPIVGATGVVVTAAGNDAGNRNAPVPPAGSNLSVDVTAAPNAPQFTDTGVTTNKRDSDGCAQGFETQIPATVSEIYVITKAVNVTAGTVMDVEWRNNGEVVGQSSWTVPNDQTNFCIWFYLDSASVTFAPGNWSVILMANQQPVAGEIPFSFVDASSGG